MSEAHKDYAGDKFGMWAVPVHRDPALRRALSALFGLSAPLSGGVSRRRALQLSRVFGTLNTVVLITSSLTVAPGHFRPAAGQEGTPACGSWARPSPWPGSSWSTSSSNGRSRSDMASIPARRRWRPVPAARTSSSGLYYVMTGAHGLHVVIGAAILGFCMLRIWQGRVTADDFGLL